MQGPGVALGKYLRTHLTNGDLAHTRDFQIGFGETHPRTF